MKKVRKPQSAKKELIDVIERLFRGAQKKLNHKQQSNIVLHLQNFRSSKEFDIALALAIIEALYKYQSDSAHKPLDPNGMAKIKCHGYWNEDGKHDCSEILEGTRQEIGMALNRCDNCRKEYKPLKGISNTKAVIAKS